MPHVTARLDLFVVPADPDGAVDLDAVRALGRQRDWWDDEGRPGPAADALVGGAFVRARLEASERPRFYANQQGGFRVACPRCGVSVVPTFQERLAAWRAGGDRTLSCPACNWHGDLAALTYRPDAAFARAALHLADVGDAAPRPDALAAIAAVWGPVRTVGRRTS